MYTKPLIRQSHTTLNVTDDIKVIGRILIAASINLRFCEKLLADPPVAVRDGFGGEKFSVSEATMRVLASIQVSTLPEFVQQLDGGLSNRLLKNGIID